MKECREWILFRKERVLQFCLQESKEMDGLGKVNRDHMEGVAGPGRAGWYSS